MIQIVKVCRDQISDWKIMEGFTASVSFQEVSVSLLILTVFIPRESGYIDSQCLSISS